MGCEECRRFVETPVPQLLRWIEHAPPQNPLTTPLPCEATKPPELMSHGETERKPTRGSKTLALEATATFPTGGGEGTHLLLALVIWPLTTHPFRDGAPFLLLIDASNIFGRSLRFFPCYVETFCLSRPLPGGCKNASFWTRKNASYLYVHLQQVGGGGEGRTHLPEKVRTQAIATHHQRAGESKKASSTTTQHQNMCLSVRGHIARITSAISDERRRGPAGRPADDANEGLIECMGRIWHHACSFQVCWLLQ